jgi:biopolymer transport protein ExbB/biopolymer transport protein TolQ
MSLFGTKAWVFYAVAGSAASPEASSADHFTLTEMVKNMGGVAIAVVIVLLIMSVYSIAIMVERYLTYSAAKKQSREFAPRVRRR